MVGKSRGGRNTRIQALTAGRGTAMAMSLSPGQAHDEVEGRKLMERLGSIQEPFQEPFQEPCNLVMGRDYEGNATRQLPWELGYIPIVPPRPHRKVQRDWSLEL